LDDLIIGAHQADPSGELAAGKSYVVFGKTNSIDSPLITKPRCILFNVITPPGGFVINGEVANDYSSFSV
jgi:hypothetical protein